MRIIQNMRIREGHNIRAALYTRHTFSITSGKPVLCTEIARHRDLCFASASRVQHLIPVGGGGGGLLQSEV